MLGAIRAARERGLSQRAMVAELTQKGFTTRKGTALSLMQGQRIMRQAAIASMYIIGNTLRVYG